MSLVVTLTVNGPGRFFTTNRASLPDDILTATSIVTFVFVLFSFVRLFAMWPPARQSTRVKIRRKTLEKLLTAQTLILPARRLMRNGLAAWAEVLHRGWEGMVAKDPESKYVGGRTLKWLKVKVPKYREGERGWAEKGG